MIRQISLFIEDTFTSDSVELTRLFAKHLAMALHRINLEKQTKEQQGVDGISVVSRYHYRTANRKIFENSVK